MDAVKKWKMPRFKTEARSFIGFVNYYRQHIPRFAVIAKPWTDVMAKGDKEEEKRPLVITKDMERSFRLMKHLLTTAPVLGFPYFHGPRAGMFTLDTDFCKDQIAAVLSQNQGGKEVVIQYGSKKLSGYQSNWPSTKGELFAGIYWMNRWSYYLQYRLFRWRTDNIALKQVRTMQCPSAIIERWRNALGDFDFNVEHRAGKQHTNADALSRFGYPEPPDDDDAGNGEPGSQETTGRARGLYAVAGTALQRAMRDLWPERRDLRAGQEDDEDLAAVGKWLDNDSVPDNLEQRRFSNTAKAYAAVFSSLVRGKGGRHHQA